MREESGAFRPCGQTGALVVSPALAVNTEKAQTRNDLLFSVQKHIPADFFFG